MEISLLGTGLLGAAIGERLLGSGYRLTVWNRHRERCGPLLALGASVAASPAEAVAAEMLGVAFEDSDGLVDFDGDCFAMTEKGRPFVRSIAAAFDSYLGAGKARHSLAV